MRVLPGAIPFVGASTVWPPLNGMAVHGGVIPYGASFMVLPITAARPPAWRRCPVSPPSSSSPRQHWLGEDGPTHQPVEHLAALRAIPSLTVIRPADANETVQAWKAALENMMARCSWR
jgi:transketolase